MKNVLKLILAMGLVSLVTVFVTKFVLEITSLPVVSDEEWDIEMCKRPLPHKCKVNGPCNGWPN